MQKKRNNFRIGERVEVVLPEGADPIPSGTWTVVYRGSIMEDNSKRLYRLRNEGNDQELTFWAMHIHPVN